jgi:ketosteroid isomerase-like protein
MRPGHTLAILLAAALGCEAAPPPKDTSAEAKQAIDAADAKWSRLSAAGHADSLADLYHVNGVMLPPNMAPVRGRDAIRAFFGTMNGMSSPPPVLAIRAESVWASGLLAVELGRWNFAWPKGAKVPPGAPAADSGKYIVRWVQENGRWLMVQDIWNSDVALPMAPGPGPEAKKS